LEVKDWRLRRWRLWFLALMTATQKIITGKVSSEVKELKSFRASLMGTQSFKKDFLRGETRPIFGKSLLTETATHNVCAV